MAEHERLIKRKQDEVDQKHRNREDGSDLSFDTYHAWDQGMVALTETQFMPRIHQHAALLAEANDDRQRANLAMYLQQTYGNKYVQRLMESKEIQAKPTAHRTPHPASRGYDYGCTQSSPRPGPASAARRSKAGSDVRTRGR